MKYRYLMRPGYVTSPMDGDRHYIGFVQLCRLYGVNPAECLNAEMPYALRGWSSEFLDNLIVLWPRDDGNYQKEVTR